jgi:hypothetical protein
VRPSSGCPGRAGDEAWWPLLDALSHNAISIERGEGPVHGRFRAGNLASGVCTVLAPRGARTLVWAHGGVPSSPPRGFAF